jgi:hypothetical protein
LLVRYISASSGIVDGQVVAPAADGTTDFSVLQNELKGKSNLTIKDVSGSASTTNTISAAPNGTDQINGSNTTQVTVRSAYGGVGLESDGVSKWTFAVNGVNIGGTGANLAATGGTSQVLKQTSAGAPVTVAQLACSDLSNAGSACPANIGTSGANIPVLNALNTWGALQTFGSGLAATDGTQSTSTSTGSIQTTGDAGIAKNANVGGVIGVGTPTSGMQANMVAAFKGAGSGIFTFGQDPGLTRYAGIWTTNGTPSGTNYNFIADSTGVDPILYFNAPGALGVVGFQTNGAFKLQLDAAGHYRTISAAKPTVSTCGTGTVNNNSTDVAGTVVATGATACTVVFNTAYVSAPMCVASDNSNTVALKVVPSTANIVVSGLTSGDTFTYHCYAQLGG